MKRVALDASVLGHLVQARARTGQTADWLECRRLLDADLELLVPAPAIAEVLAAHPMEHQQRLFNDLRALFPVLELSDEAAAASARLHGERTEIDALPGRPALKVDALIVGCCCSRFADVDFLCTLETQGMPRMVQRAQRALGVRLKCVNPYSLTSPQGSLL